MAEDDDELRFYRDEAGEIRWSYVSAGNYEKLADGGEGYERLHDAMVSAYRVTGIQDPGRHSAIAAATHSIAANRPDGSAVRVVLEDGV